jgi:hypothetical protein
MKEDISSKAHLEKDFNPHESFKTFKSPNLCSREECFDRIKANLNVKIEQGFWKSKE